MKIEELKIKELEEKLEMMTQAFNKTQQVNADLLNTLSEMREDFKRERLLWEQLQELKEMEI